jgi:hypothetical protein
MLNEIMTVASSGGLGAIVGLFGGILTRFQQYKVRKIELEHDQKMRLYDLQEAKLERQHFLDMADKQMDIAEQEGEIAYEQADLANLRESIRQAGRDSGIEFVEIVRGLMRPFITLFLLIAASALVGILWDKVGGLDAFTQAELIEIFKHTVYQMVFLTVTAVTWWFASRGSYFSKEKNKIGL